MTANPVEICWTAVALVGLIITAWALVDAVADLHYLQALGLNGAREIVARGSARNETFRVVIHALLFLIGIVSMLTGPANPDRPVTPPGIVVGAGFCAVVVLLVVKSGMDRRDRHRVIASLARKDEAT